MHGYSFDPATSVATVTLSTGNKMNAFSTAAVRALNAALDRAERDMGEDRGALVIASADSRAFSAGFDLGVMGGKDTDAESVHARSELLNEGLALLLRLFVFGRPVVAAVGGHALAFGALILLACAPANARMVHAAA